MAIEDLKRHSIISERWKDSKSQVVLIRLPLARREGQKGLTWLSDLLIWTGTAY